MIFTSYFGKLRKIPKDIARISICRLAPTNYRGLQYKILAPSLEPMLELKRSGNRKSYTQKFEQEVLRNLDAAEVMMDLAALTDSAENIVLLCYEKDCEACHRSIVSNWLNEYGIACEEWNEEAHMKDMSVQMRMEI